MLERARALGRSGLTEIERAAYEERENLYNVSEPSRAASARDESVARPRPADNQPVASLSHEQLQTLLQQGAVSLDEIREIQNYFDATLLEAKRAVSLPSDIALDFRIRPCERIDVFRAPIGIRFTRHYSQKQGGGSESYTVPDRLGLGSARETIMSALSSFTTSRHLVLRGDELDRAARPRLLFRWNEPRSEKW